ncbi:MAG: HRDC domain-containing protein [Halothiobacillaceae bacterium]|nr:HRDC domain-containing protein [Halothiobacillaceae bacterium]HER34850.1 hypothetical protein [Halothiobacillaceae bacterium]
MTSAAEHRFVTDDNAVESLLDAIEQADALPLDTEFIRERTYFPRLALLQIATGPTVWLVDPTSGTDLSPLWEALVTTRTPVVLHAGDQDLDLILGAAGRLPRKVFDSQIAAELLGIGSQMSYAALVETLLDVTLDKAEKRSDWLARPLSRRQIEYAVQDVAQLQSLYPLLRQRLADLDRLDWMAEETSEQLRPERFAPDDRERWKKISGVQSLDRAGLASLRELAAWRECRARELDRPRRWVWDDQAMLDLAHSVARAQTPASVEQIESRLARARTPLGKDVEARRALADTIAAALDQDPANWPRPPRPPVLPAAQRELVKSWQDQLAVAAAESGVTASRLATSADLKRHLLDPERPSRLTRGWRAPLLAPILRAHD